MMKKTIIASMVLVTSLLATPVMAENNFGVDLESMSLEDLISLKDAVADRIRADKELDIPITIYYNGTALYGDVTIEGRGGASKEFKKALSIFNEEYCK